LLANKNFELLTCIQGKVTPNLCTATKLSISTSLSSERFNSV